MKLVQAILLFGLLASCSNPALMVMDDASEAFYEWQGYGPVRLAEAAAEKGFDLTIKKVAGGEDLVQTVEQAYQAASRISGLVLILPPVFGNEARLSTERFEGIQVLLLGENDAPPDIGGTQVNGSLVSVSVDRSSAFTEMGRWLGSSLSEMPNSPKPFKVLACFIEATDKERNELARFREALGMQEAVEIQSFALPPSSDEIRVLVEDVRQNGYELLILFAGQSDPLILKSLGDWSGWLITENAGGLAADMPRLAAGIDVNWGLALSALLGEVVIPPPSVVESRAITVQASFRNFRSISGETFASSTP